MDLQGQQLSERVFHAIVGSVSALALVVGYVAQNMQLMMIVFAGGVALGLLVCMPEWPQYRRHPLEFLKTPPEAAPEAKSASETSSVPENSPRKPDKKGKLRKRAG